MMSSAFYQKIAALGLSARPAQVFGVDYQHVTIEGENAGDLYVTEFGAPFLDHILPSNWRDQTYYAQPENKHLSVRLHGSAHPHRITTQPVDGKTIDIVVKWCRVGKEVLLAQTGLAEYIDETQVASARWNGPFEEFGLLAELRDLNPYYDRPLLTQRPFAIYAPLEKAKLWETGRTESKWRFHKRLHQDDQRDIPADEAIELDVHRLYALIYGWVRGEDAAITFPKTRLDGAALRELTREITVDHLESRGYRVFDIKPEHFIVRQKGDDVLRDKKGRIIYALIDFELLQRTRAYDKLFRRAQRAKYWALLRTRDSEPMTRGKDQTPANIFGVDYVCSETSNLGRLWTLGKQPELPAYFDALRWRRTPRVQLSSTTFRTVTLDNIQLVYRSSRVGMKAQQDPSTEHGRRAREFGLNSPFEEVAIAEELRAQGVKTVFPRAIYRTAHESLPVEWLRDDSRYKSHADIISADGEPVLFQGHDYYTLWGCWRGSDPVGLYDETEQCGVFDAVQAAEEGLLRNKEFDDLIGSTKARLQKIGFAEEISDDRVVISYQRGEMVKDDADRPIVTVCVNGYRAYELGLIDLQEYNQMVSRTKQRLRRRGYTPHNLKGDHLILSITPEGEVARDVKGAIDAVLCNFAEIRAPWMVY